MTFHLVLIAVFTIVVSNNIVESADVKPGASSDSDVISIQYLNILSRIQVRFATTWVTSRIKNSAQNATEVVFFAQIPDGAFITNFSMQIDDKTVYGNVKEKEKAKEEFEAAKSRGESAGLIAKKPRESNLFQINVNLAAQSKVNFNLTYQEILQRVHGVYKHVVDVQTNYPAESVNIEINIHERGEITDLKVPRYEEKIGEKTNKELLTYASEKDAQIERSINANQSSVTIKFSPRDKQQKAAGQLAVLYDVRRDDKGGSIEVVDGYFVHFFAPDGLPKGNKRIIFVLDKSGSMMGRKFQQLQQAVKVMLNDLNPDDIFNIIFFSTNSEVWKKESVKATPENVKAAQTYVADTEARGSTDISRSMTLGLKTLDAAGSKSDALASMLLFLTDGQPTEGITDGNVLVTNITASNTKHFIINCIGFGEDADMLLMKRVASQNKGLSKKVYEDSDAALQLTGFFDEVSNPLLSQVKIKYLNDTVDVDSVIQSSASNYFDGGEIVTIGKVKEKSNDKIEADVSASGKAGLQEFRSTSVPWICPRWGWGCCPRPMPWAGGAMMPIMHPPCCWDDVCPPWPPRWTTPAPKAPLPANTLGGFVERMWAYQTIKKLLKDVELDEDGKSDGKKEADKKKALDLSLKYSFVTDLTSMVVVQPQTEKPIKLEKVDQRPSASVGSSSGSGSSGNFFGGNFASRSSNGAGFGGQMGAVAPAPRGPVGSDKWDSFGSNGQSPISGTEKAGEKQKSKQDSCQLQTVILLDSELDKSPNAKTTSVMVSNTILKLTLDKPNSSATKIIASLGDNKNSTAEKRNITSEVLNQLSSSSSKSGKSDSSKNYVVLFAPYQNLRSSVAKAVKDLAAAKNVNVLIVVLEQYSKDRLSQLNDIAKSDKNVLINPSLDDILSKLSC